MHECRQCLMVCDCDGDDTWLNPPRNCRHECDDEDDGADRCEFCHRLWAYCECDE
jgi:hypothetical protein